MLSQGRAGSSNSLRLRLFRIISIFWKSALVIIFAARLAHPDASCAAFANGVDPTGLGKGDWIWLIGNSESRLGFTNTQQIIDYEVAMGMKWIAVRSSDGTNVSAQFTPALVAQAHAAGLKIFGAPYASGVSTNQVKIETALATNALFYGADGLMIDAESEYEHSTNNQALAAQYLQGIRAAYSNYFIAYTPVYKISVHTNFPYAVFGYYCDAAMPQLYWITYGSTPSGILDEMDYEWTTWQNGLTGTNRNAIKPVLPVGESFSPTPQATNSGAMMNEFFNAVKNDTSPATPGGYGSISFWDCSERNADMDAALKAMVMGGPLNAQFKRVQLNSGTHFQITMDGRLGGTYEIDRSINLTNWAAIATFVNSNGVFQFNDPTAATNRVGYYRAKWLSN